MKNTIFLVAIGFTFGCTFTSPSVNRESTLPQRVEGTQNYGNPMRRFEGAHLRFEYPYGWRLSEKQRPSGKVQVLVPDKGEVEISVVLADLVPNASPSELEEVQSRLVNRYVENMKGFVKENDGSVESQSEVSVQVGKDVARGMRLRVRLWGEKGNIDVYTFVRNGRVVGLGYAGPDSELRETASAWGVIRETLEVF